MFGSTRIGVPVDITVAMRTHLSQYLEEINTLKNSVQAHSTEMYFLIDTLWKIIFFKKGFLVCVNGINLYMSIDQSNSVHCVYIIDIIYTMYLPVCVCACHCVSVLENLLSK